MGEDRGVAFPVAAAAFLPAAVLAPVFPSFGAIPPRLGSPRDVGFTAGIPIAIGFLFVAGTPGLALPARSYRPGVAFGVVAGRAAIGGRLDPGPVGDVDRWLRLASRRRCRSVRTGARAASPVIRALFADDRLRQEERGLEIGGFGARRRGRRSRRGARLADVAQVVDAGEDVLADAAAHQALAQLQLVGDDLEARLALGTGGRERHRARSWSGGSEGPGDHACLVPLRQA